MAEPDVMCVACRERFFASRVVPCDACQAPTCPCCGAHQVMIQLGSFDVSPEHVDLVRASLQGRPN